jgi:hypothetical protein
MDESVFQGNYNMQFDVSGLPAGSYFLKVSADKFSFTKKMMVGY